MSTVQIAFKNLTYLDQGIAQCFALDGGRGQYRRWICIFLSLRIQDLL